MDDFDRPVENDAGRDIEDKAVAEKGAVERGETPIAVGRGYLQRLANQLRPRVDCRRSRAEPNARGQPLDRGKFGHKPPIDQHQAMIAAGEADVVELRRGYGAACADRKQGRLLERAQIEVAPSFAAAARKALLGKAGEAASAVAREPIGLAGMPQGSVQIGPRFGLDREIDDSAHLRSLAGIMPRRQTRHSRAVRVRPPVTCHPTRRSARPAAHAPGRARHNPRAAGSG